MDTGNANKHQLLQALKMGVHNLQVLSASQGQEPITHREHAAMEVLFVLENILRLGLKDLGIFTSTTIWDFLQKVSDCIPNGKKLVSQIKSLGRSSIARGRVFIRLGINTHCLDEYLKALLWNQKLTSTYYGADSVLTDEDQANVFLSLLDLLREVPFKLALNEKGMEQADFWVMYKRQRERALRRESMGGGSTPGGLQTPVGGDSTGRSGRRPGRPSAVSSEEEAALRQQLKEAQEANVNFRIEMEKANLERHALQMRARVAETQLKEQAGEVEVYRRYLAEVAPGKSLQQLQEELQEAEGEDNGTDEDQDWDATLMKLGSLLNRASQAVGAVKASDSKLTNHLVHSGTKHRARTHSQMAAAGRQQQQQQQQEASGGAA